ncbi:type VI secretion protein [Winslowiella iniecta]|uniref:Type VI secretion protein n=4 Tax=Winslowiella iniecta TaxID=1560201 RepID=A0A0L7SZD5_9GAMM|nr:type VI secretion system protein TssA [Winslowiella iniecta]KOC88539.1 type VI secretion protein [Winslowiella iniecta]
MLQKLIQRCFTQRDASQQAQQQLEQWQAWLHPISEQQPVGDDPAYDDDFQRMREEVNKLSGVDTALIAQLAQKLLTEQCKDVRVATYYSWARLHQEGESGLAAGLTLLAGLVERFGQQLLPTRAKSRKAALEWLAGSKIQDSLSLYPEASRQDIENIIAALALLDGQFADWDDASRPDLSGLVKLLEKRLTLAGGEAPAAASAVVSGEQSAPAPAVQSAPAAVQRIQSGRDLLDQARELSRYLRDQPQGWLASSRLMRSVRWDTVHQLPPQDSAGRTRLMPPRAELRAQLKRLHLQQSWMELLEQVERMFIEGVNHFWLDLQWYACQALTKSGHPYEQWSEIAKRDLGMFLERLPELELQYFNDGTPFADDTTRQWIEQHVQGNQQRWQPDTQAVTPGENYDIYALEGEALTKADSEGLDAALRWIASLPEMTSMRDRWLQRLLMARVAEQCGKNEMAQHLLSELDHSAAPLQLAQWEPALMFEVKARLLKLLRLKLQRSEGDKVALAQQIDALLAGLVAIDPAQAAVLCQ